MRELLPYVLGLGIPLVMASILGIVYFAVRGAMEKRRAALVQEGIVLDSGPQWITIRLNGFRGGGMAAGVGYRKDRVTLVLTAHRLVLVPSIRPYAQLARSDLAHFTVSIADGHVRLHSDDPPRGTGSIDYRVPVADPARWMDALVTAGARPAS